jgi:cephalosporin-C deacetylase-like acetyl esterase
MRNLISLFLLIFISLLYSQNLPLSTNPPLDQSNDIRTYLMRVAAEISDKALSQFTTLDDWTSVNEKRHQQFVEMMGLYDVPLKGERPPLNVKIVDTLQMDGYRIVKLYYESLPKLYVPADLYIPDNIEKPKPAVLYVCGHSRTQKVHYQPHARGFAKLGFVCLIIETIQWGEVKGEHWGCYANGWFHWYSRGYTPGGVELWNAIRGLDLLSERPEVDAEKLGVTGISGGGSQSWYIAAADPRIKAAAPVCGASTLKAQIHTKTIDGHCDCMMPINTYGWDFHDIGSLFAPRPLLIGQANRDGLNVVESVREIYHGIKNIYELYDASDNVSLVETPGGHSYHKVSRQKIFSFFLKHLMDKDVTYADIEDVDESEENLLSVEQLKIYINGAPKDDRTTTIQESFIKIPKAPEIKTRADLKNHRENVLSFLKEKTFAAFPQNPVPMDSRLEFRTNDGSRFGRKVYSFVSEKDWRLRVDIRWRNSEREKHPIMIVLRNPNEERWASEGFISGLDQKYNIAYFEARGIGETGWAPNLQWHVRRASAWTGRTVASMQVYDVLRCIEFLKTLSGVDEQEIAIGTQNEMTSVALYAALLNGDIAELILYNPVETQNAPSLPNGRGPAIEMLNCVRITDVWQLPALLQETNVGILGNVPETFKWSIDLDKKLGDGRVGIIGAVSEM